MIKTFMYRLFPTKKQTKLLSNSLEQCRFVYNNMLEQRKSLWENEKKSVSMYDQINTLPWLKCEFPELKSVHSQVLQNVAVRVDLAFKGFFRRVKAKDNPGYPRFKGKGRYQSITFCAYGNGIKIEHNKLKVSKIGAIKISQHRELLGKPKTATIKVSPTGKWHVSIHCEVDKNELLTNDKAIGVDVGLRKFATFSDNSHIINPRFFKVEEKNLAKAQRLFSEQEKGSTKRKKRSKVVARIHERIKFRRDNFCHQESRKLVNKYQVICFEDLEVERMKHNKCFSKSISDAAWTKFTNMTQCKAEEAGRTVILVNPAYTSQDCSKCGHREKKEIFERVHNCKCCGLKLDRDHNAAINILRRGLASLGLALETPSFTT